MAAAQKQDIDREPEDRLTLSINLKSSLYVDIDILKEETTEQLGVSM